MNYAILFNLLPLPYEVIYKIYKMCRGYKVRRVERILKKYQIKNIKQNRTKFKYHLYYH